MPLGRPPQQLMTLSVLQTDPHHLHAGRLGASQADIEILKRQTSLRRQLQLRGGQLVRLRVRLVVSDIVTRDDDIE